MAIEEVVDSVRRIVKRWCVTQSPLTADASAGDSSITIKSTVRFEVGNEIILRDSSASGEINFYITSIPDNFTLVLSKSVDTDWYTSSNAVAEKVLYHRFVQGVYIGDPLAIMGYPAITVNPISRDSEWLTLDSTQETYNLEIGVYVEDSNQEDTFRFLLQMVDTIQHGLKQHIYPLVGPYTTTSLEENIAIGDTYIKVSDSSIFDTNENHRIIIEDPWDSQEFIVTEVIDSNTILVNNPSCYTFNIADGTLVIYATRFIYNSWPASINYGKIFHGSMLKAATIDWFAWEEEIQLQPPMSPSIV